MGCFFERKRNITITNTFQKTLDESVHNKEKSAHNEGKYAGAERFIRTLKSRICKCMTEVSKNMYNKTDGIVDK